MARIQGVPQLPKPNRTTLQIVAAAALACAAAWFFMVRPFNADLDKADAQSAKISSELHDESSLLQAYRQGEVMEGGALADAVGAVESQLPKGGNGAGQTFAVLQQAAQARGLVVSDLEVGSEYKRPDGDSASGYPGLLVALGSMRLSGPTNQLLAFLGELDAYPQLVTYDSSGITGAPEAPTMQLQVRLWATEHPEWRNGVPAEAGRG